jgi:dimethylhistidine N-methyltransferase
MTAQIQLHEEGAVVAPLRFYDFRERGMGFLADVQTGLSVRHKLIPPRWFFDAEGARLFSVLAEVPEFYAQRCELGLLKAHMPEVLEAIGPDAQFMTFGSGGLAAARYLMLQLRPALHLQIDADAIAAGVALKSLAAVFPTLSMAGIVADASRHIVLPEFIGTQAAIRNKAAFLPGWSLGSLTADELFATLQQTRRMLGTGGVLLAGVALKKLRKLLDAACNDAGGAMAAFNAHVLSRVNAELGGDIQTRRFRHLAFYDELKGRVEMFMESQYSQFAHVGGTRFDFDAGEAVLTGISCKYTDEEFMSLASEAGFTSRKVWTDEPRQFSLHVMAAV